MFQPLIFFLCVISNKKTARIERTGMFFHINKDTGEISMRNKADDAASPLLLAVTCALFFNMYISVSVCSPFSLTEAIDRKRLFLHKHANVSLFPL